MPTTAKCPPGTCGCAATTAQDALAKAMRLHGHVRPGADEQEAASAMLYLLREYGWTIVRDA